jgi:hypothetical protein
MPRWVKLLALVLGVLFLAGAAVMFLSGGEHGPARHGLGLAIDRAGVPATTIGIAAPIVAVRR